MRRSNSPGPESSLRAPTPAPGEPTEPPAAYPTWIRVLAGAVAAGALTGLLGVPRAGCLAALVLAVLVQVGQSVWPGPAAAGQLLGGLIAGGAADALARSTHLPVAPLAVAGGLIPLVPGILTATASTDLLQRRWRAAASHAWEAAWLAAGLALGVRLAGLLGQVVGP